MIFGDSSGNWRFSWSFRSSPCSIKPSPPSHGVLLSESSRIKSKVSPKKFVFSRVQSNLPFLVFTSLLPWVFFFWASPYCSLDILFLFLVTLVLSMSWSSHVLLLHNLNSRALEIRSSPDSPLGSLCPAMNATSPPFLNIFRWYLSLIPDKT